MSGTRPGIELGQATGVPGLSRHGGVLPILLITAAVSAPCCGGAGRGPRAHAVSPFGLKAKMARAPRKAEEILRTERPEYNAAPWGRHGVPPPRVTRADRTGRRKRK